MITYHINRFIHSIIRENKLVNLMELLISKDKKEDVLFIDFIKQLKSFLKKENELIFDDTKLKYIAFLEDFKNNIENIKDLKEKNKIEANSVLFNLYDIPKKRNNLLLVFLLYFYINNKDKLWWDEIFKIIYVYFMIIVYRNRISKESRDKLIEIDKIKFKTIKEILTEKINIILKKHKFLKSKKIRFSVSMLLIFGLSVLGYFNMSWNLLKADINQVNNSTFWKVALDSMMTWRISDPIMSSLQNIWFQNIILVVAFILLIQSLKTSLSTVFFNSLLTKIFQFLWAVIKYFWRIIFYIYNYITHKLATKYIFSFLGSIVSKRIVPNSIMIWFFSLIYFLIYFLVINLYIFFFIWIFKIPMVVLYIIPSWIIISFLVIYLNFHNDLNNFKTFLMEIELIIKNIYDKAEGEKTIPK
ncbi:MAG: hypothetical protein ACD_4C00348G0003 [uncultured bacterium (gcode 4)]|uniref:Uncharacterized protein n=1 Tax=uncultured bacterium (gcode 4) TaxID=1234023 RepID=K2FTN8_9BACT|nr:MAG: hypothetical protein ACD_4C00348G0003 [uncultured bacterium (gcode 4)]